MPQLSLLSNVLGNIVLSLLGPISSFPVFSYLIVRNPLGSKYCIFAQFWHCFLIKTDTSEMFPPLINITIFHTSNHYRCYDIFKLIANTYRFLQLIFVKTSPLLCILFTHFIHLQNQALLNMLKEWRNRVVIQKNFIISLLQFSIDFFY